MPMGVTIDIEGASAQSLSAEVVLVSIGRRPYAQGLGLEAIGVARDPQGRIVVDDGFATNVPGIYAIGDVIRGPMLAHKAMDEGVALAERLAGQQPSIDYHAIPAVVYTWPEVASVGKHRGGTEGGGDRLTAPASSRSPPRLAPGPTATPRDSSRSSPTARPTGFWAYTSSAPTPAR